MVSNVKKSQLIEQLHVMTKQPIESSCLVWCFTVYLSVGSFGLCGQNFLCPKYLLYYCTEMFPVPHWYCLPFHILSGL